MICWAGFSPASASGSNLSSAEFRRHFKLAFHLILAILVRKSELMLAQWKDVHFDSAEWYVPVENSKTGKPAHTARSALDESKLLVMNLPVRIESKGSAEPP
jgi:integrase